MNVLNILFFIFWIASAAYFYYQWIRKHFSKMNPYVLFSGFILKVILGCIYGYVFLNYFKNDDTWLFHQQSLKETSQLLDSPSAFLKSLFLYGDLERYEMTSIWKEIEYTSFIKILAIFNLFSGGNYFLNIFIYNSITFAAPVILCKMFIDINPSRKQLYYLIFFFFIPFVFWTSGIRREGFILLFLANTLYQCSRWIEMQSVKRLTVTLIMLFLLSVFRYSLAISILPFLILWIVMEKRSIKMNPWILNSFVTIIAAISFFATKWVGPINLPGFIAEQQNDFLQLKGGSFIHMEPLKDNVLSFLKNLPNAIDHSFFRPYPLATGTIFIQFSKIETWAVALFIIYFIFSKPKIKQPSFGIPMLFFIIINYIFLGYTVPFTGAMVRYRIIYEVLLLAWMVSFMNQGKPEKNDR